MFPLLRSYTLARSVIPYLRRMSTQTIAVLNESELKPGEMKQVAFGSGQILLSKLGEKIHATSAYCTHYGAPLAKGVLTSDGRVVCPWHGACFSVCTGDIEDAPAPDAIHSFQTRVSDGKIYVTADPASTEKDNKSRRPTLQASYAEGGEKGVLIIGGGSAAFQAVESLREHGYKGAITIVSKELYAPIDRTKLSKALITDASKLEWRNAADLKIKYGVTLRTGVEVTSVDLKSKKVQLKGSNEPLGYQKLIIASGGVPRRLPIEGVDFKNVFTFRDIQDSTNVDAAAKEGANVVVIGSSFISMELAAAMSKRKLASLHVIGMESVPFERVLGKEVGAALMKFHESQGVKFHMNSKVDKIVAKNDDSTLAAGVAVNGETLPADFVIMGVGVAPATKFLEGSGIPLEKDGAVKVDEFLAVQGLPSGVSDVYAVGDIASYPQVTGDYARIEHWNVAGNHGRHVGKVIAGQRQPFTKVPVFWSAQGQQLRYCGLGHDFQEVIVQGDLDALKFIAYYVKDEKVVAVASMQNDPVVSKASELMRLGLMPSAENIRKGADILSIDISTPSVSKLE
ncbi:hypothetical protein BDV98DRAFT_563426 [Pterulicium gracile]|uniref:Rieske domain-containing protein n=1 Tax=Pterulicium gracile TaxID=1884261 RepID=A0A5C3QUK5_9AGAR|nr:hypothetical protein BDV98DRAFT_563426 [Pterula gracilis]